MKKSIKLCALLMVVGYFNLNIDKEIFADDVPSMQKNIKVIDLVNKQVEILNKSIENKDEQLSVISFQKANWDDSLKKSPQEIIVVIDPKGLQTPISVKKVKSMVIFSKNNVARLARNMNYFRQDMQKAFTKYSQKDLPNWVYNTAGFIGGIVGALGLDFYMHRENNNNIEAVLKQFKT